MAFNGPIFNGVFMKSERDWKAEINSFLKMLQVEVKKTTEIGKRMLTASKTNSGLHESFEELGRKTYKSLKDKSLIWENADVQELVTLIEVQEKDLENIEVDLKKIKSGSDLSADS